MEQAFLATVDHFKEAKKKIEFRDQVFQSRLRVELVWRAYRDTDDNPIAESTDELAKEPPELITTLHHEWDLFHQDVAIHALNEEQMTELIDILKKNTQLDRLGVLPSTWLIGLITTLVNQPASSTPASEVGS
jgi:hypothetical protein